MNKEKIATQVIGPVGNSIEAGGVYTFEWLDEAGNVVDKSEHHNLFTGHWNKYLADMQKYFDLQKIPAQPLELMPGMICLYDDTSPVTSVLGYRDYGVLRGTIDLAWDNPNNSDPIQGNRTLNLWDIERVDAKTQKLTMVGEFGTSTANGLSNKVRLFGTQTNRMLRSADTDDTSARQHYDRHIQMTQGVSAGGLVGDAVSPRGSLFRPVGWTQAEWEDRSGTNYIPAISTCLSAVNANFVAITNGLNMDNKAPQVALCPYAAGSMIPMVPGTRADIGDKTSADAVVIQLESLASSNDYRYYSAGTLMTNNDYIHVHIDGTTLTVRHYDASGGYAHSTDTVTVVSPGTVRFTGCTAVGNNLYVLAGVNNTNMTIWTIDIATKTLTATKDIDVSAVESYSMSNTYIRPSNVWLDTATNGWIVEWVYFSSSDESPFGTSHVGYLWYDNSAAITVREQYKVLGVVTGTAGLVVNSVYSSVAQVFSSGPNRSYFESSLARIFAGQDPATSIASALTEPCGFVRYIPDLGVTMRINDDTMAYAYAPACFIGTPLISEAAIAPITKTSANSLRVTYVLTITEN